jgi:hypothetical protein
MKIDFGFVLRTLDGASISDEKGEMTAQRLACGALLADAQGDKPEGKLERFRLAIKISEATGPVDLTIDEMKLLQDRVTKSCGSLVVGRMDQLLNGRA